jgi:hypothetical protein
MKYPMELEYRYAHCNWCGYGWAPYLRFESDEQDSVSVECPRCKHKFKISRELVLDEERKHDEKIEAKCVNWDIKCLRCETKMEYMGENRLILDTEDRPWKIFLFGHLQHMIMERNLRVALFRCPKCNHAEFFMPSDIEQL